MGEGRWGREGTEGSLQDGTPPIVSDGISPFQTLVARQPAPVLYRSSLHVSYCNISPVSSASAAAIFVF
ncbi:hypothetical protein SK128_017142, partial [Halocaridina rubra]